MAEDWVSPVAAESSMVHRVMGLQHYWGFGEEATSWRMRRMQNTDLQETCLH